jgi:transposase, IS5 family
VRKKLGNEKVQKIERLFTEELIAKKVITGKYLFSDTTSLEKNISYPTEVSLLKRVIEHAEMVVQGVVKKKELVKTAVIRKANRIAKVYYSASEKTKELLEGATKQLLAIAKDTLERAAVRFHRSGKRVREGLKKGFERVERVGKRIVEQVEGKLRGEKVTDRIVSYYEEEARALPKGKVHKPCEFGHKVRLDMNGDGYITNWRLCRGNPADVGMLEEVVEEHAERFGEAFLAGAMDRGYYDGEKIGKLEETYGICLAIPHKSDRKKKLSRRERRLCNKRSAIESRISEGKRMVGLDKSYYRGFEGDGIWAAFTVMALNIRKVLMEIRKKPGVRRKLALSNGWMGEMGR